MKTVRVTIIFALWLIVMSLFFQKEVSPLLRGRSDDRDHYRLASPTLFRDEWLAITFGGEEVGYSHTALYPYREEGFYGSALENTVWLEVPILQKKSRLQAHSLCLILPGGGSKSLTFEARSSRPNFSLRGEVAGDALEISIETGGETKELKLPFPQNPIPLYALTPFLTVRPLEEGDSFTLPALDPLRSIFSGVWEAGTIRFEVAEKTEDGYRLLAFYGGMTIDVLLDPSGNVLKALTSIGWGLEKRNHKEIIAFIRGLSGKNPNGEKTR